MAFKKGTSGNPSGRPKGNTPAVMIRQAITGSMPAIIKVLIDAAKNGDIAAAKILIDKACPSLKPQAVSIDLPTDGTLAEQGNMIIEATLSGQIPVDVGSQLLAALGAQARVIDFTETADRIAVLEERIGK